MTIEHILIANRGEIAIRIARAASELGKRTTAIFSRDDVHNLHVSKSDQAVALPGSGVAAYMDLEQIIKIALRSACQAIHPGYGFLSERVEFAEACTDAGIVFVGPSAETLQIFGDKLSAKALARRCDVPLVAGTLGETSLDEAREFFASLPAGSGLMVKALAGGGGRGMRSVRDADSLEQAFDRCQSEALSSFGNGALYVEQLVLQARHIEIQMLGDGSGAVSCIGDRECSLQRQHQKLMEIAPSPSLSSDLRAKICAAAVRMAEAVNLCGLATFEFLLNSDGQYTFMETNPRLQVEHTVTEEVSGIDLVQAQIHLAEGASLSDLNLAQNQLPATRGCAVQVRINMETLDAQANAIPAGGVLATFDVPQGPGVRCDTFAYTGYSSVVSFDSLLAKIVVHANAPFAQVIKKTYRALCETRIEGVDTNLALLKNLLRHPALITNEVHTQFISEQIEVLRKIEKHPDFVPDASVQSTGPSDTSLGLAQSEKQDSALGAVVPAPLQGTIIEINVEEGALVQENQQLLIMEAMKMEHVIKAEVSGRVSRICVAVNEAVFAQHGLMYIEAAEVEQAKLEEEKVLDPQQIRPDLAEVHARHAQGLDAARPSAVARRRKTGHRTARENIADLCDPDTFVEYGALMIAAQRRRRSQQDLIENTPADGMVAGIGSVNGSMFPKASGLSQCVVMSYDYTVLAGTQGAQNHRKKDRLFEIAEKQSLPVILIAEGGGGRPGDTDGIGGSGLDCLAFVFFAQLSALVPLVGITTGRCFAGNAALLGCCDVIIATRDSNIGMGGPAMIEGGGLGIYRPEQVGPMCDQLPNGVVDIAVADEAEAVQVGKKYLSYFQGICAEWACEDQQKLRTAIPENRLRIYDIRNVIEILADTHSVLELRSQFAKGMITALARIEGEPVGIIANNPAHLAGAIDSDGADKAARFMQLCDAFDLPILFLCDTPGIMVGPEVEKTALVRHAARMFVVGASLEVPFFTLVLRKAYGLGAQAMAGGSFKAPLFTVSWPTGEFGGMGLEGAVKLGYRKELSEQQDPEARQVLYEEKVARMYEQGKAINSASYFMIDEVIDPADTRNWIKMALLSVPDRPHFRTRKARKRPCIDTW